MTSLEIETGMPWQDLAPPAPRTALVGAVGESC
jgi:hypothetical protein